MVEMECTNWEAGLTSNDISVSPSIVMPRRYLLCVPRASKSLLNLKPFFKTGSLLATPTSFWQHRIGPLFAFPQQLLQVTRIFSLHPPTFLSTKINELTLT